MSPTTKSFFISLLLNLLIQPFDAWACGEHHHHPHDNEAPTKRLFDIPKGSSARVSIIDSTARLRGSRPSDLLTPYIPGFDNFSHPSPSWSFLVENSKGDKRALFDLGGPPNFTESYSPAIQRVIQTAPWTFSVDKHVVDILRENRVNPASIGSIVWSHSHFDHIGDPSTFPHSTDLVVGPGWKAAFLPAYPTDPDSPVKDAYWQGRNLVEIDFTKKPLKIGAFSALDFFGDGSFYLLDAPGHSVGHMTALARTTSKRKDRDDQDTFIYMGGDLVHHASEIRPSKLVPFPRNAEHKYPCRPTKPKTKPPTRCPGTEAFRALNVELGRDPDGPTTDPTLFVNFTQAKQSIEKTQAADASENVFVIWAHYAEIEGTVDLFPKFANDWKKKGWRDKVFWSYLMDLAPAATNVSLLEKKC
ncbi:beta-lactamase-like protein [Rhypophila decipiens]|uniref:Beta-lactamase-like protein n=1 Tax=Rhypophila decipiens TaxID=261697 RepID=A0AAN6YD76_9PEZI|nr:beta-lactamase-like protein [Rhypophila decipiens]